MSKKLDNEDKRFLAVLIAFLLLAWLGAAGVSIVTHQWQTFSTISFIYLGGAAIGFVAWGVDKLAKRWWP